MSATTSSGAQNNSVYTTGAGKVTVGGGGITIIETSSSATSNNINQVYTGSSGSLSTAGQIVIVATNNSAGANATTNEVFTNASQSSGKLSALGISISDLGSATQQNYIFSSGAAISVGVVGITIVGSGSGYHDNEIFTDGANSPITITGPVNVIDVGTGHSDFFLVADFANSFITVSGSVTYYDLPNSTGRSRVGIYGITTQPNALLTINGPLVVYLAQTAGTAADNQGYTANTLQIGSNAGTGYGTIVSGFTTVLGSNGQDKVYLYDTQLKLGALIDLQSNPGSASDYLEIDGSSIGGPLTAILLGDNADIDINNGHGFQTTSFAGLFYAIMTGSHPVINVATGTVSGHSAVAYNGSALIAGVPGLGGIFKYHPANVTGIITLSYFTKIVV
jgi:hypothetical protein